jgi:hypothetical protein
MEFWTKTAMGIGLGSSGEEESKRDNGIAKGVRMLHCYPADKASLTFAETEGRTTRRAASTCCLPAKCHGKWKGKMGEVTRGRHHVVRTQ